MQNYLIRAATLAAAYCDQWDGPFISSLTLSITDDGNNGVIGEATTVRDEDSVKTFDEIFERLFFERDPAFGAIAILYGYATEGDIRYYWIMSVMLPGTSEVCIVRSPIIGEEGNWTIPHGIHIPDVTRAYIPVLESLLETPKTRKPSFKCRETLPKDTRSVFQDIERICRGLYNN